MFLGSLLIFVIVDGRLRGFCCGFICWVGCFTRCFAVCLLSIGFVLLPVVIWLDLFGFDFGVNCEFDICGN